MSNKPKTEKRIVKYSPNAKEQKYTSLCKIAYGEKGTTKKMKQIKAAAKAENGPRMKRLFNLPLYIPGF